MSEYSNQVETKLRRRTSGDSFGIGLPDPGKRTLVAGLPAPIQRKADDRAGVSTPEYARSSSTPAATRSGFEARAGLVLGEVSALQAAQSSGGQPLPAELRERFEQSLGADLGAVRVHTGSKSEAAAKAVRAKAYATGSDIHFGAGQYDTGSKDGQRLLAHEVAHTVQQGASPARAGAQFKLEVSTAHDALEIEADRAADEMISGRPTSVTRNTTPRIARVPEYDAAGDEGAKAMAKHYRSSRANALSNIGDKQQAQTMVNVISSSQGIMEEGTPNQVKPAELAQNSVVLGLLQSYLESADTQSVHINLFQGLYGVLLADFGRMRQMFDQYKNDFGVTEILPTDPKEREEARGASQAGVIFGPDDPKKLKAQAMKLDKGLAARFEGLETDKANLSVTGNKIKVAGGMLAGQVAVASNLRRQLVAKAGMAKDPAVVAALADARSKAGIDTAAAIGTIAKEVIVAAGVGFAFGGPAGAAAGAAAGAGKAAASSVAKGLLIPKLEQLAEESNAKVGKFPDKSAERDDLKGELAIYNAVKALQDRIRSQSREVKAQGENLESEFQTYVLARKKYTDDMKEVGRHMDELLHQVNQPARSKKDFCDGKPPPPRNKDKGPRFEIAFQFMSEADKFVAQAETTLGQGKDELQVRKKAGDKIDPKNAAVDASKKLNEMRTGPDAQTHYFVAHFEMVKEKSGRTWKKIWTSRSNFVLNTGKNPDRVPKFDGSPDEAHKTGSAEGGAGFGANERIDKMIDKTEEMRDIVTGYRNSLSSAIGM